MTRYSTVNKVGMADRNKNAIDRDRSGCLPHILPVRIDEESFAFHRGYDPIPKRGPPELIQDTSSAILSRFESDTDK